MVHPPQRIDGAHRQHILAALAGGIRGVRRTPDRLLHLHRAVAHRRLGARGGAVCVHGVDGRPDGGAGIFDFARPRGQVVAEGHGDILGLADLTDVLILGDDELVVRRRFTPAGDGVALAVVDVLGGVAVGIDGADQVVAILGILVRVGRVGRRVLVQVDALVVVAQPRVRRGAGDGDQVADLIVAVVDLDLEFVVVGIALRHHLGDGADQPIAVIDFVVAQFEHAARAVGDGVQRRRVLVDALVAEGEAFAVGFLDVAQGVDFALKRLFALEVVAHHALGEEVEDGRVLFGIDVVGIFDQRGVVAQLRLVEERIVVYLEVGGRVKRGLRRVRNRVDEGVAGAFAAHNGDPSTVVADQTHGQVVVPPRAEDAAAV